jgi:addiction module HigA family antidote
MTLRERDIAPTHPGEVLREDFILPTNTSMNKLALGLHVAPTRIYEIVKGQRSVTADTALRLARYLGTTPDFWMNLQQQYDLERTREEFANAIEQEVRPRRTQRSATTGMSRRKRNTARAASGRK